MAFFVELIITATLNPYSYLFESVEGGEKWGRYSMIGLHAKTVIKVFDYDVHIEYQGELLESNKVDDLI
jgi:anthranilate synthase component 1